MLKRSRESINMPGEKRGRIDYSTWMTDLPENLKAAPISLLAIPGTHNSFTYTLTKKSPVGPDNPGWIKNLGKYLR